MSDLNLTIGLVCQHGQLARSCDICGYQQEIASLQRERDDLRAAFDADHASFTRIKAERDEACALLRECRAALDQALNGYLNGYCYWMAELGALLARLDALLWKEGA